jgi:hypothetical protein
MLILHSGRALWDRFFTAAPRPRSVVVSEGRASRKKPEFRQFSSWEALSRRKIGRQPHHVVPKGPVAGLSPRKHVGQQRFIGVDIVVDDDLSLGRMEPVKTERRCLSRRT